MPNELEVLHKVSISIEEGELVAIVGESGSGKSTLMNIIGALDRPTEGTYLLGGVDVAELSQNQLSHLRKGRVGFVFQTFNLVGRITARANVEMPMTYARVSKRERAERAERLLELVGMGDRSRHKPNELSGGQRQRVAIARALVGEPSLLLADEPTGNLDSATGEDIIRLFEELNRAGHTILLVTHEPRLAARCPRAVRLSDGKVVADGPGKDVAAMQLPRAVGT